MKNKGFSLFEVMVVITITSIMAVVAVSLYIKSTNKKALSLAKEQVVNDVKMTQDYSYSVLKFGSSFPEGGYGIHFDDDAGSYIVFADSSDPINQAYDDPVEKVSEISFLKNIKINSLKIDGGASLSFVDIVFKPPYGEVYINGVQDVNKMLEIEIINDEGKTAIITIRGSRMVD